MRKAYRILKDDNVEKLQELLRDPNSTLNTKSTDSNGSTLLHLAVRYGATQCVGYLLGQDSSKEVLENKDKINDETPLILATRKGYFEIVKQLIEHGADINATSRESKSTVMHFAAGAKQNSFEIVEYLIDKGLDVKVKDEDGDTPLHYVSTAEVAKLLLDKGADVNAKDNKNHSPLVYALKCEDNSIAALLLSYGAKVNTGVGEKNKTLLYTAFEDEDYAKFIEPFSNALYNQGMLHKALPHSTLIGVSLGGFAAVEALLIFSASTSVMCGIALGVAVAAFTVSMGLFDRSFKQKIEETRKEAAEARI